MKTIAELNLPEDLHYSKDHEWARSEEGPQVRVGISDYAQDQMGDVVYVELPQVGDRFQREEAFGTVESVKAVNELFMPVDGEITAVNEALEQTPEAVNQDPYKQGWMVIVKVDDSAQLNDLMDRAAYVNLLKG